MPDTQILQYAKDLTMTGMLLIILWSAVKDPPSWVPWSRFKETRDDRDFWRAQALRLLDVTDSAVGLVERAHRP